MAISSVKLWWCFPPITGQKWEQRCPTAANTKPHRCTAKRPQVQGFPDKKNYQNTQGKVLWLWGWVLELKQAGLWRAGHAPLLREG